MAVLLAAGCLERFTASDVSLCEEGYDGLLVKGGIRDGRYDRVEKRWEHAGPVVEGYLLCDVEQRPVSEFGLRIHTPTIGTFVFYPETSSVDADGAPSHRLIQYHDNGTTQQSAHHVPGATSVGLAVGGWAADTPASPSATTGYPSREALYDLSYESDDADDALDPFPPGPLWFDVWLQREPSWFVRFAFTITDDGTVLSPAWSIHADAAVHEDAQTGQPVPALETSLNSP